MMSEKHPWHFVDPPPSDYYCPMCVEVLHEPMLTNCCGSHFCKACIEPIFQAKKPCPNSECKESDYLCIVDKPMWKKILELDIMCPLKGRGCNWMGEVGTRDKHLDLKEGDCEYIDVVCTKGCGEEMERYELSEHLEKFCHKRPFTCVHCGIENVYEVIMNDHMPECPAHPVTCPNNCGREDITRSVYPYHLEECPEQEVACEFSYAGCTQRVKRKEMAQHQRDDVYTHLTLQTAFASKQLAERDEQMRKMADRWEEKFQKSTDQWKEKFQESTDRWEEKFQVLTKQLEWMKTELKRKELKIAELRGIHKLESSFSISSERTLTLKHGNIVSEDVDVIVNSYGGREHRHGVSKALNLASNGHLKAHTDQFFEAHTESHHSALFPFLTEAGGSLKCKQVMHAFRPNYSTMGLDSASLLRLCIKGVLESAERKSISSIAIPAISAGARGGDPKQVAEIISDTIMEYKYTKPYPVLSDIRIVIRDDSTHKVFAQYLKQRTA